MASFKYIGMNVACHCQSAVNNAFALFPIVSKGVLSPVGATPTDNSNPKRLNVAVM